MIFSKICFTFLIIFLILPFVVKWYLTKYLPAWTELIDLLKNSKS